jgi:hypothetical protein
MAGCATAIGSDNLLVGSVGAMRTLAAHMYDLYTHTPATNLSRAYHRVKPHHEEIVPIEIARLGLCCPELDAFVRLRGSGGEARPTFAEEGHAMTHGARTRTWVSSRASGDGTFAKSLVPEQCRAARTVASRRACIARGGRA